MEALVASSSSAPPNSLLVEAAVIQPWTNAVRVAALLHDAGHVFLSHAGERILTTIGCPGLSPNISAMLSGFREELDCEKRPGLAEFFSFAIMTSKPVVALCERHNLRVQGQSAKTALEVLQILAGALVHARSRVADHDRWLADVLSGPLDVDKQDYVPRDALMAGVGVQVEPHRCAEVVRVCDFRDARVLNEAEPRISKTERRLVITFAGISVLEDLLLSRMSLFLRVYKHHKVRLLERLVERIFAVLHEIGLLSLLTVEDGFGPVMGISDSLFYDGELLRRVRNKRHELTEELQDKEATERRVTDDLPKLRTSLSKIRVVEELARMLNERDFPVRAFAYGKMFPSADRIPTKSTQERHNEAWSTLMTDAISPTERARLESEIVEASLKLAELAEMNVSNDDEALLRAAVCLDLPAPTTVDLAPVYVCTQADNKDLVSYEQLFQPSQWLDALQDSKIVCYVHAPRAMAHVVHAGAELVFARKYGAMSQHLRGAYSRFNQELLLEFKEKLASLPGNNRHNEPVEGLHLVLTYPSFIRRQDREALARIRPRSTPESLDPDQTARFHRIYDDDGEQIGIIVDIQGSTKFCKSVEVNNLGKEGAVRESLLVELERSLVESVRDNSFGILPLKTEGDAAVLVAALSSELPTAIEELLKRLWTFCRNEWPKKVEALAAEKGWGPAISESALSLRVLLGRGDVDYKSQLGDILGSGATSLFVNEAELKRWPANTGLVILGARTNVPPTWIEAEQQLDHVKTGTTTAVAIRVGELA